MRAGNRSRSPAPGSTRRYAGIRRRSGGLSAGLGDLSAVGMVAVDGTSGTLIAIHGVGRPVAPLSLYSSPADPARVRQIAAIAPAESAARGATSPLARVLALQAAPSVTRVLHEADWITGLRIPMKSDMHSNSKPATDSDLKPAGYSDLMSAT